MNFASNISVCILVAFAGQVSPSVTFRDGDFDDVDWDSTVYLNASGSGGTASWALETTGGIPSRFRDVLVHTYDTTPDHYNVVIVTFRWLGGSYDPAGQGAISSLSYSEDAIHISGLGDGHAVGPALWQNGNVYIAWIDVAPDFAWVHKQEQALSEEDFWLVDPTQPLAIDFNSHPDFSSNGSPIEFGFNRSQSNATVGGPNHVGIDNWRLTVRQKVRLR